MAIKIPVGIEDFEEIRRGNCYYVDKTELLYELAENTDNKVTLFTRPRRFGKTLTMKMMESFFDIRRDSRDLFDGLNIADHSEFCEKWMNRYPVLFISLKSAEGGNFDLAYEKLSASVADLCKKLNFVKNDIHVDSDDLEIFLRLKSKKGSEEEIHNSLKTIMRMMYNVYGRRVILLIDEYDVPMSKAAEYLRTDPSYYTKMMGVIRGIFDAALKTNEYLEFAVITGCMRVSGESIFTGTNNFKSYSVLDEDFSEYFGFTQEEVNRLLEAGGRQEKENVLKKWYDGYIFGNTYVYCPWDVVNYVSALMKRENAKPKNYWKNTSHNGILLSFIEHTDFDVSGDFETLMNGGIISPAVSDDLTYDDLYETKDNLWSVLLMTGYLTKADSRADYNDSTVDLKIPNEEIFGIFRDTVVKHFEKSMDRVKHSELMNVLWNGDESRASELITDMLYDTISYHNYSEKFYQGFLAGLMNAAEGADVKTDFEKGLGRPDVVVTDRRRRRIMIIETKVSDSAENLEKKCREAVEQIERMEYMKSFTGPESTVCFGVAFYRKTAMVKRMQ